MKPVLSLIWVNILDLVRQKVVLSFLLLSVFLFFFSLLLGSMSISEQQRILTHLGLSGIHISTVVLAAILGANLLHKEIEKQTCLVVLSRPISRLQYLLAISAAVFVVMLAMVHVLGLLLYSLLGFSLPFLTYYMSLIGIVFEGLLTLLIAILFALMVRPALAVLASFGIFIVGHWLTDLKFFAQKSGSVVFVSFAEVIQWLIPHFEKLNWRSHHLIKESLVTSDVFFWVTIHVLGWSLFLLLLCVMLFRRKDLA